MSDTISFGDRLFTSPSGAVFLEKSDRLALAYFSGGTARFGFDTIKHLITPEAADLSYVRTGRCPLLIDHSYTLDALLGQVVAAELEGPLLRCLVRFTRTPAAEKVWGLLADGLPLSLSWGCSIQHAVKLRDLEDGAAAYQAVRWRLREISVVVFGKDESACMHEIGRDVQPQAMIDRMDRWHGDAARSAARSTLQLRRWEQWAGPAGKRIAEQLGVDADRLAPALEDEVARHGEQLMYELAPTTAPDVGSMAA